jgi:hypothetical protein
MRDHRGRDRIVIGFTTTYATIAYHHLSCEFKHRSWRGLLDTRLCDQICQWLAAGRWFSTGTPVSSTNKIKVITKLPNSEQSYKGKVKTHSHNKTDSHNIIEIELKHHKTNKPTNQQPYHIRLVTNVFIEFLISWFAMTLVMTKTFGIPTIIRRVLKIPKGSNQNPYIVEEQITQWQNQKLQTTI